MNDPSIGQLYLVGAGPGDPGLITLRAVQCLSKADVVLYDYLVNPQLLEHVRPAAELVCLGRHGQGRIMPQEEINQRIVAAARGGRTVVRLKGGDPTIFARGIEEAEAATAAGIAVEVVPGISAALATASYAGIPITHRDLASCVAFVTGQQGKNGAAPAIDFKALARFPGTLVFYMGVTSAPAWSRSLIAAGKAADTAVAVVRRCSWPDQQVIRCRLDELPRVVGPGRLRPPAIMVVGPAARQKQAVAWFAARPLAGQTVLVTRPREQAVGLRDRFAELGAEVLVAAAIAITDPPDWHVVDDVIAQIGSFDWLVFSSANGVRYLLDRIVSTGRDLRCLGPVRIAAIGPGTADQLASYHLRADVRPEVFRAEALAEALCAEARGRRFLLARASRGREVLAERLTAAGALVQQTVVYTSEDVTSADPPVAQALAAGRIDWTTVTSSAIARALTHQFGAALAKTKLVTISPITSATLRSCGCEPALEATTYTVDGVIDAIVQAAGRDGG